MPPVVRVAIGSAEPGRVLRRDSGKLNSCVAQWTGSYSTAAATSKPACSKPSERPPAPAKRSTTLGRQASLGPGSGLGVVPGAEPVTHSFLSNTDEFAAVKLLHHRVIETATGRAGPQARGDLPHDLQRVTI